MVFRFLIIKLDLKTPGRGDEPAKLYRKADIKAKQAGEKAMDERELKAAAFLQALGG